ncbi:MAG TPA: AMP-binding protein [Candidatus Acidoferrales bacterium]|nr:AMP-binding protein [Candidatus Acidoferrales bacterium]
MATSATKFGHKTSDATTNDIIRQLLAELGSRRTLEVFAHKGSTAHLERDLGLGSLERVELLLRLDAAFAIHLPEKIVAEAETVADLQSAVQKQTSGQVETVCESAHASAHFPEVTKTEVPAYHRERLLREIAKAETLTDVVRIRGRADAETKHIFLYEDDEKIRTIACGELFDRASAVATELAARGVRPGNTVAIMLPTCAEFFYTFAGILLAGAIPVPIYPPFRADRIAEYASRQSGILRNAEALLLVTFREAAGVAKLLEASVPSLLGVVTADGLTWSNGPSVPPSTEIRPTEAQSHAARSSEIAFLQYTSGSTGNPKGVVLTHANLLANIRSMTEGVGVRADDVAVSWLPLYHDMGLIGAWFVPLVNAIPLVVMSPLAFLTRPERWLRAIHRHRGTLSPAPNFAYELCVRKIAAKDIEGLDLSCWRAALNGAEPVRAETVERFTEIFAGYGFRRGALVGVYGLAESSLGVAAPPMGSGTRVDRIQRTPFEGRGQAIPAAAEDRSAIEFVSAGRPLPGMQIRVVESDGSEACERVEGKLLFRGASATSGYYRNPEATRELVREDGWLDSGDLAYIAEGDLFITGRAKDMIIKGGRNLYPHEIEEIAGRVAGVRTGCVVAFGAPDAASGTERLVVAAEARDRAAGDRIAQEITRVVSDALGLPPDIVEILPLHAIPKTSSGKLRRSETRRLYLEGKLSAESPPVWFQIGKLAARTFLPRTFSALQKIVRRTGQIAYGIYALAMFTVAALLVWLLLLPVRNHGFARRLIHSASRCLLWLAAIRVSVVGEEILDEWKKTAPWIFAPNHSSYLDILIFLAYLPAEARFVAKGEVRSMPFIRTLVARSGHFAFERSDPQARLEQAAEIERALQSGDSVVIYPEGTFTAAAGIRPFQLGAFKSSVNTGRRICPIALRGARELLRDKTWLPKPGRVTLTLGPLVAPSQGTENDWHEIVRLRDETREIISRGSGEPLL